MTSQYTGVTYSQNNPKLPWRAQLAVSGHTHYLGSYATEREAAEIYDNAAYHIMVHRAAGPNTRKRSLNFPATYSCAYPPDPTQITRELFAKLCKEVPRPLDVRLSSDNLTALVSALTEAASRFEALAHETLEQAQRTAETLRNSGKEFDAMRTSILNLRTCPVCKRVCNVDPGFFSDCCHAQLEK
jgi:hypothetical protein